jgi:hypothetical protein
VSNRRAQDERIEGTPDGVNAITEIVDVPDAPTIGTATAGIAGASVPFTAATTGGTVSTYTATSTPGSLTGTSATSPITVSGLTVGTAYTFTVTPSNSTGTGPASSSSNSITPVDLISGYDSLSSVTVPSGGATSVSFVGIPSGYQHLQLRCFARTNYSTGSDYFPVILNGDTTTTYRTHQLFGVGSGTPTANAYTDTTNGMYAQRIGGNPQAYFGGVIIDLLDYASVTKNKVMRSFGGVDFNGTAEGQVYFNSGLYLVSNTAISTITLNGGSGGTFLQYSQFALYGVK